MNQKTGFDFAFFRTQIKKEEEKKKDLYYSLSYLDFYHNPEQELDISHLMTLYNPHFPEHPIPIIVEKSYSSAETPNEITKTSYDPSVIINLITFLYKAHIIGNGIGRDTSYRKIAKIPPISELDLALHRVERGLPYRELSPEALDKLVIRFASQPDRIEQARIMLEKEKNIYTHENVAPVGKEINYTIMTGKRMGEEIGISRNILSGRTIRDESNNIVISSPSAMSYLGHFLEQTIPYHEAQSSFNILGLKYIHGPNGEIYDWTQGNKQSLQNFCNILTLAGFLHPHRDPQNPKALISEKVRNLNDIVLQTTQKPNFDDGDPHGDGNR